MEPIKEPNFAKLFAQPDSLVNDTQSLFLNNTALQKMVAEKVDHSEILQQYVTKLADALPPQGLSLPLLQLTPTYLQNPQFVANIGQLLAPIQIEQFQIAPLQPVYVDAQQEQNDCTIF